jgi:hypothetical protein
MSFICIFEEFWGYVTLNIHTIEEMSSQFSFSSEDNCIP